MQDNITQGYIEVVSRHILYLHRISKVQVMLLPLCIGQKPSVENKSIILVFEYKMDAPR
jgi:hypothetical protein